MNAWLLESTQHAFRRKLAAILIGLFVLVHGQSLFRDYGHLLACVALDCFFRRRSVDAPGEMEGCKLNSGDILAWHYSMRTPVRVEWQAGIITSVAAAPEAPSDLWIAPGLFDLQVNGYGGVDFQRDTITREDLFHAVRRMRTDGCTRFFLTLVTDKWPAMLARLQKFRNWRSQSDELKNSIAGWHIEGPFLSAQPGFHGAHDPALTCDPTPEHIRELRAGTGSDPLLLTMAPERRGALECIALAATLGMKVSLGHTDASAGTLAEAVKAGASGFTHLGNGCTQQLDRHDNILWRVFETPGLTAGVIPDRIHVSAPLFRIFHRQLSRIYYTTDAVSPAGAPPGRYSIGRWEVDVGADQVVRPAGKTHLAGSALRPIQGVFRAAEMLGCAWQESWPRASLEPARVAGFNEPLIAGQPADFCLLKQPGSNGPGELQVYARGEVCAHEPE